MKRHAPATLRNRDAIAEVLNKELPVRGTVLEIASGTGEHALYFALHFPGLIWQPSDCDAEAVASIAAYRTEHAVPNLAAPLMFDTTDANWPVAEADALFCANMIHISPWPSTEALFVNGGRILPPDAPLVLYGPFLERDVATAPSNMEFDRSLKARNPEWGVRALDRVDALAARTGFVRSARYAMPANNLCIVYRRQA